MNSSNSQVRRNDSSRPSSTSTCMFETMEPRQLHAAHPAALAVVQPLPVSAPAVHVEQKEEARQVKAVPPKHNIGKSQ